VGVAHKFAKLRECMFESLSSVCVKPGHPRMPCAFLIRDWQSIAKVGPALPGLTV
jgi:hypothetical protein